MSGRGSWRRLTVQFTAAPRKSALLAALVAVLALMMIWQLRREPASLEAASGPNSNDAGKEAPSVRDNRVTSRSATAPPLPQSAARDPFTVDWTLFPPVARTGAESASADAAASGDEVPTWSLELTLTMLGGEEGPTAVINGRSVGVGDSIEGATVESIAAQEVVLSTPRWGRLVLRME